MPITVNQMIRKLLERSEDKVTDRLLYILLTYDTRRNVILKKEDGEVIAPEDVQTACLDGVKVYVA